MGRVGLPCVVLLVLSAFALPLALDGCRGGDESGDGLVAYRIQPRGESFKDPDVDWSQYHTFRILEPSGELPDLVLRALGRVVGANLELLGYSSEDEGHPADFLVWLYASNEYGSFSVPPVAYSVPVYTPGGSATVTSSSGERWRVKEKDSWRLETRVKPGKSVSAYYPWIGLSVYDHQKLLRLLAEGETGETAFKAALAWECTASASTEATETLLALQGPLWFCLSRLPVASGGGDPASRFGMSVLLGTSADGELIVPVAVDIVKGGPADRAGLLQWDVLWRIGLVPVDNASTGQIRQLLLRIPVSGAEFQVTRRGEPTILRIP